MIYGMVDGDLQAKIVEAGKFNARYERRIFSGPSGWRGPKRGSWRRSQNHRGRSPADNHSADEGFFRVRFRHRNPNRPDLLSWTRAASRILSRALGSIEICWVPGKRRRYFVWISSRIRLSVSCEGRGPATRTRHLSILK